VKRLSVPPLQDISRIIAPTDRETTAALIEYYDSEAGVFNYSLSQKIARYVFAHETTLDMAYQACAKERTETGRTQNREVLELVWQAGSARKLTPYDVKPKVFSIRKDLQIKVSPAFYFVENRKANVFWLQPRRRYALNDVQLGLLASILKLTYLVDDFESVGLELLDLSVPEGEKSRGSRTFQLDTLPMIPLSEVETLLQSFARAFDAVTAAGVQRKKRRQKHLRPDPDLFDRS
jgi:hypothetical protein